MSNLNNTGVVNIKGKHYTTVAKRVNDFRDNAEYAAYKIITEIIERNEEVVVMKCSILNAENIIVATGHAEEYRDDKSSTVNKTSALENCETSAIGRALACFGKGGSEFASADELTRVLSGEKQEYKKLNVLNDNNINIILDAINNIKDYDELIKYYKEICKQYSEQNIKNNQNIMQAFTSRKELLLKQSQSNDSNSDNSTNQ